MKKISNVYILLIIMVVFMSCLSEPEFDENLWLERVNAVDPQLLYATNRDARGKFFNPWMPRSEEKSINPMYHLFGKKQEFPDIDNELYSHVENQYDYLFDTNFDSISYVGHSSFFIKIDGATIITDPFFSDRAVTASKEVKIKIDFFKIPEKPVVLISR